MPRFSVSHRLARASLLASGCSALWALAAPAAAQQVLVPAPANVVTLSAEASAEVTQDMLSITLAVVREGADAANVQSQLRQVLDAALTEARKSVRPGQLDVRTGSFGLWPRQSAPRPNVPPSIQGWSGRAELVLEGRDIAAISALAGKLPGMTVAQLGFGLSREARDKVEAEVSAQAIARFRARAERHAQAFGFASYSLREVNVGTAEASGSPVPMMARARLAAAPMADESQPVEAGRATVSVQVNGSIQLSPR